jgi:hypothetical protein
VTYYVYELIDPRNDLPFYVGKGKNTRIDAHEAEARKGRLSRKCDLIREIEAAGFSITKRKIRWFSDEQAAYDFEADMVDSYGLGSLTNVNFGGGSPRSGHSAYRDRIYVRAAAEIINRTRNGVISNIWIAGDKLDLLPIIETYKVRAFEVISRRGFEWCNAIGARFGVEFSYAGA